MAEEKKKRQNTQFTLFMITQDLEHHIGKSAKKINDQVENRVGENYEFAHTIVHNRDCQCVWNYQKKQYEAVPKNEHAHTVLKLKKKVTINALADLLGIEPQYIEKPKAGNNALGKMLAYLIHARDPDKFLYDPTEVYSSVGAIPYTEIYAKNKKQWEMDRARVRTKQTEIETDDLIEKIETGEIIDREQILLTDEYYRCYSRNSGRIDKALEIASQRRQAQNVQRIKDGNLKQAIFITGAPRKGKSYLTDQITDALGKEHGWRVNSGAASNCFDNYNGEEIFILDDARGSSMKAEEWTRLLDPRKANWGSARFHHKMMSPQVIIFNCYKDVDEFFYFTKGIGENDKSEALDQFIGRILIRIFVHKPDDIDVSLAHERPSTRTISFEDRYGNLEEHTIHTDHSFVTLCEHQTNENVVALVSALICANQHAGKVTDAMMNAVAKLQIPYNNILLDDENEIEVQPVVTMDDYHELEKQVEYFRSLWQSSVKNVAEYKGRLEEAGLLTEWEQMMLID